MSIDTLSIVETARIYGSSRQNIIEHIRKGNMPAQRGKERKRDWRVSPAGFMQLAQNQFNNFLASLGIYLFANTLHDNNLISDEAYEKTKTACHETLKIAYSVDALVPLLDDMAANHDFIKDLLNEGKNSAA